MGEHIARGSHQVTTVAIYLASRLVVRSHDQLHAICLHLEAIEEIDDVKLGGVERQRLDLDNAV